MAAGADSRGDPMSLLPARTAFRFSLAAGLIVLALSIYSILHPGLRCGSLPEGYAPIIAFELARTQADLDAVFGVSDVSCRAGMIAQMDATNWVDALLFVPIYGAFLLFFFTGMRERDLRLGNAGIAASWIAIVGDYFENTCLMQLTPSLDAASVWFALLPWATGIKWLALGIGCGLGASLFAARQPRNFLLGLLCVPGFLVTVATLIDPGRFGPHLSLGIALGWLAFLVAAAIGSFRRVPVQ